MTTMPRIGLVCVSLVLILLASCGVKKTSLNLSQLDNSSWMVTHMNGTQLPEDVEMYFTFDLKEGRLYGKAACNSFGAAISLTKEGAFQASNPMSTRMACPHMMAEHAFIASLTSAQFLRQEGNVLYLYETADTHATPCLTMSRR